MQAYSIEQNIMEGKIEINDLFEFVKLDEPVFLSWHIFLKFTSG
jgi:hypothetical protein